MKIEIVHLICAVCGRITVRPRASHYAYGSHCRHETCQATLYKTLSRRDLRDRARNPVSTVVPDVWDAEPCHQKQDAHPMMSMQQGETAIQAREALLKRAERGGEFDCVRLPGLPTPMGTDGFDLQGDFLRGVDMGDLA